MGLHMASTWNRFPIISLAKLKERENIYHYLEENEEIFRTEFKYYFIIVRFRHYFQSLETEEEREITF